MFTSALIHTLAIRFVQPFGFHYLPVAIFSEHERDGANFETFKLGAPLDEASGTIYRLFKLVRPQEYIRRG